MVYYIPKIVGGLCNQLFQIFSILGLSKRDNVDFKLCYDIIDLSETKKHSGRNSYFDNLLIKLNDFFINNLENYVFINENQAIKNYYENIKDYDKNIMFNGYFQDPYFLNLLGVQFIKNLLNFPIVDISKYNVDNAFFIHYRRGDYVNNNYHGFLNDSYYEKALNFYPKNTTILICSNELNYGIDKPIFKDRNIIFINEDEIITLYILSNCKFGGICANSSFSWWGIYLNESNDKIICMPNKWFNDNVPTDKYYFSNTNIIPI
jgi:hypothetical protein